MTCREKLTIEHPDRVGNLWAGGCCGCPQTYEYLDPPENCNGYGNNNECTKCWDREIPEPQPITYEHTTEPIGKVVEVTENENGVTAKIELTNSHDVRNEKEKNMASRKTKAELEKELETVKESKEELEKELQNLEKYKQYEDMAGEIHALYMAYVHAGFSEGQAYDLLKTMMQNAGNITFNTAIAPTYKNRR